MSNQQLYSVTLSNTYAGMLSRHLADIGAQSKDGIERSTSLSKPFDRHMSIKELRKLTKLIADEAGDYGFGLQLGCNIHPSDYGVVGYALMNVPTLFDAVELATRYKYLLNEGLLASIELKDGDVYYRLENIFNLDVMNPMVELDFASAIQLSRLLAGPHRQDGIRLKKVAFQHAPLTTMQRYEDCFQCPVAFDQQQNLIVIDYDELDIPVHGANPKILTMMQSKLLRHLKYNKTKLSVRVHAYLSEFIESDLPGELPDLLSTAERFHMSISAFKKRLQLEQSSFQQLCDEVRRDEACRLLNENQLSVKEISYQLGFLSASAFSRAFKRWMQVTPAEYRKGL